MSIHLWKPSYFRGALNFASEFFFFPKKEVWLIAKIFLISFPSNPHIEIEKLYNQPKIIHHVHLTGLKP